MRGTSRVCDYRGEMIRLKIEGIEDGLTQRAAWQEPEWWRFCLFPEDHRRACVAAEQRLIQRDITTGDAISSRSCFQASCGGQQRCDPGTRHRRLSWVDTSQPRLKHENKAKELDRMLQLCKHQLTLLRRVSEMPGLTSRVECRHGQLGSCGGHC